MSARSLKWNEFWFYNHNASVMHSRLSLPTRTAPYIVYNDNIKQGPKELAFDITIGLAEDYAINSLRAIYQNCLKHDEWFQRDDCEIPVKV